jgi:hypothetical protein
VLSTRFACTEQSYKIARFLLAVLHVESLLDKMTKKEVLSTLEKLPKGSAALDEAYGEATKRDGQLAGRRSLAKRALSWITYAQRLLTTKELCHALTIEPGDKVLNNNNAYDVEDVISVCADLVTEDKESNIIRFVDISSHQSQDPSPLPALAYRRCHPS